MSAAERLRELRNRGSQVPGWVKEVSPEQAYLAGLDDAIDALPEIIAVVEAAEQVSQHGEFIHFGQLYRALEALDVKLAP